MIVFFVEETVTEFIEHPSYIVSCVTETYVKSSKASAVVCACDGSSPPVGTPVEPGRTSDFWTAGEKVAGENENISSSGGFMTHVP